MSPGEQGRPFRVRGQQIPSMRSTTDRGRIRGGWSRCFPGHLLPVDLRTIDPRGESLDLLAGVVRSRAGWPSADSPIASSEWFPRRCRRIETAGPASGTSTVERNKRYSQSSGSKDKSMSMSRTGPTRIRKRTQVSVNWSWPLGAAARKARCLISASTGAIFTRRFWRIHPRSRRRWRGEASESGERTRGFRDCCSIRPMLRTSVAKSLVGNLRSGSSVGAIVAGVLLVRSVAEMPTVRLDHD